MATEDHDPGYDPEDADARPAADGADATGARSDERETDATADDAEALDDGPGESVDDGCSGDTMDDHPVEVETPASGDGYASGSVKRILEAALLVAGRPLAIGDFEKLFGGGTEAPPRNAVRAALAELAADWSGRSLALQEVASGWRAQVRTEFEPWIARLWDEKPPRYSRALLETLAIIAYRQPMTRSDIEDIRGVSVSSQIIRTLTEREWIRVVGHREAPGRPAMYGTTREFLDYFNLKTLDQLPPISDIKDLEGQYPELGFEAEPASKVTAAAAVAHDDGVAPDSHGQDADQAAATADSDPAGASADRGDMNVGAEDARHPLDDALDIGYAGADVETPPSTDKDADEDDDDDEEEEESPCTPAS